MGEIAVNDRVRGFSVARNRNRRRFCVVAAVAALSATTPSWHAGAGAAGVEGDPLIRSTGSITSEDDWLALAYAVNKGDITTVKQLLARGVKPDAPHPNHMRQFSALDNAILTVDFGLGSKMAELLLAHRADINDQDNADGATPLMVASLKGRSDYAALLLKRGAQVNLTDRTGRTALDFALTGTDAAHSGVAEILRRHGAVAGTGVQTTTQTQSAASSTPVTATDQSVNSGPPGVPGDLVTFANTAANVATVFLDGSQVCVLNQGANCSVQLWANDSSSNAQTKHTVHIALGGSSYDDPSGGISVDACHWNWAGTSTYTISDSGVHFDCVK